MLDLALTFLVDSLNAYLRVRSSGGLGQVVLGRLVDDSGKWAITLDRIGAALVNVEEERVLRSQLAESTLVNGHQVTLPPELKLNLHVLFAAHFQAYDQGLLFLSHVLTFFQTYPTFTPGKHPGLDPRIQRLTPELQSLSYEQLNQLWTFIGAKHLPSALYKVRMVALRDPEPLGLGQPITRIDTAVGQR